MSIAQLRKGAACACAAIIALSTLLFSGCSIIDAELHNRGGFSDKKLDNYFIIADTKQMRVLRAYLLIGSIARLSREHYYRSERETIIQHINSAILVANDAFACAYARIGDCVYFDERMAEFEIALLRLAVSVFSKNENESLFEVLSKNLSETSTLFKGLDSIGKIADAAVASSDFAVHAGKVVASLVKIGGGAYTTGRRLGALYRDAIELDMVAVLGSLQTHCHVLHDQLATEKKQLNAKLSDREFSAISVTSSQFYGKVSAAGNPCEIYKVGHDLWARGAGDLSKWQNFLTTKAAAFRTTIIPGDIAFMQASDLIWRACEQITDNSVLVSKCLGARPKIWECGCQKDDTNKQGNCPILADMRNANRQEIKVRATHEKLAKQDTCPLIAFYETWDARNNRFSGASTRLDWVSLPRDSKIRLSDRVTRQQSDIYE